MEDYQSRGSNENYAFGMQLETNACVDSICCNADETCSWLSFIHNTNNLKSTRRSLPRAAHIRQHKAKRALQ